MIMYFTLYLFNHLFIYLIIYSYIDRSLRREVILEYFHNIFNAQLHLVSLVSSEPDLSSRKNIYSFKLPQFQ